MLWGEPRTRSWSIRDRTFNLVAAVLTVFLLPLALRAKDSNNSSSDSDDSSSDSSSDSSDDSSSSSDDSSSDSDDSSSSSSSSSSSDSSDSGSSSDSDQGPPRKRKRQKWACCDEWVFCLFVFLFFFFFFQRSQLVGSEFIEPLLDYENRKAGVGSQLCSVLFYNYFLSVLLLTSSQVCTSLSWTNFKKYAETNKTLQFKSCDFSTQVYF